MKSGVGDPFDDTDEQDDQEPETMDAVDPESEPETTASGSDEPESGTESDGADGSNSAGTGAQSLSEYPLKLRRNNVKDERPNVHQLFVQDSTDTAATAAERDLEDRLGESLYRLDAREAIYLAGMRNLDEAEEILRTWGYDL